MYRLKKTASNWIFLNPKICISAVLLLKAPTVLYVMSKWELFPSTVTWRRSESFCNKQTYRLISGLADARLHGGCGPSTVTGSKIKARMVAVEEDSLLGD